MPCFVLDLSWSESGWQSYLGFCRVPKGRDGGMTLPLAHLQAEFFDVICLLIRISFSMWDIQVLVWSLQCPLIEVNAWKILL